MRLQLLWTHAHRAPAQLIIALYVISHYVMGVIVYMEMDRIKNTGGAACPAPLLVRHAASPPVEVPCRAVSDSRAASARLTGTTHALPPLLLPLCFRVPVRTTHTQGGTT